MNTEAFIRDKAKANWSRMMVAGALGIDYQKFLGVARLMPDVVWPAPGKSVDWERSKIARRGHCSAAQAGAVSKALAARRVKMPKHTVGGFTGTLSEVRQHWLEQVDVSLCQVNRRLARGDSLLDALFGKKIKPQGTKNNVRFWN